MQTRNDGTHVILPAAARSQDGRTAPDCLERRSVSPMEKCATTVPVLQISSAATSSQSAEDCTAHPNSTQEYGIVAQSIEWCIIVYYRMNDDGQQVEQSTTVSVRSLHIAQFLTGFPTFHTQGKSSSSRLMGCPSTMRMSTSRSQAYGSTSLSLQVSINEHSTAQR